MAGLVSEGFSKIEVVTDESSSPSSQSKTETTTVYSGKSPSPDVSSTTDDNTGWKIMRTVIIKDRNGTTITHTWAEGPWTDRALLTYKYF